MDLPNANWNNFQVLSPLQAAQNQQALQEVNQLGQLQIDTKKQEMQTENALAPYKIKEAGYNDQQAGETNDLKQVDYQNAMVADVAQRAQAADPADAPKIWDDGMSALADKGIGLASQYIGHYRPDLAEKVTDSYGGAAGGSRGARGADGAGAQGASNFDVDAVNRSLANVPPAQLQKALANMNRAIGSFNNVKDQDSWNAELQALKEAGIDPSKFLPSTEWNPLNYAAAHRAIQNLTQYRDAVADRLAPMSVGLPGMTPKPMYEPQEQYIGTNQQGQPVILDTHGGGITTPYKGSISPKPSAGMSTFMLKQNAWLAANPGDTQGALQFANGKRNMQPAQIQIEAHKLANQQLYDETAALAVIPNPDQWIAQRTQEIEQQLMGAPLASGGAPLARTNGGKPATKAPARMSQSDVQASIAAARAALKRHPDKRGIIMARLKAAGVPTTGL